MLTQNDKEQKTDNCCDPDNRPPSARQHPSPRLIRQVSNRLAGWFLLHNNWGVQGEGEIRSAEEGAAVSVEDREPEAIAERIVLQRLMAQTWKMPARLLVSCSGCDLEFLISNTAQDIG